MTIWMTHKSFADTSEALKDRELLESIVDSANLLERLMDGGDRTPFGLVWSNDLSALAVYGATLSVTAARRGIVVGHYLDIGRIASRNELVHQYETMVHPAWTGDTDVLRSHRSNLVRRWSVYKAVFPGTPGDWPYLWPFSDGHGGYTLRLSKHDQGLLASGQRSLPASVLERIST